MNDVGNAVSGKVVQLRETPAFRRKLRRPARKPDGGCAQLLLFTGVRYERNSGRARDLTGGRRSDYEWAPSRG
jgi:hypothetical protein